MKTAILASLLVFSVSASSWACIPSAIKSTQWEITPNGFGRSALELTIGGSNFEKSYVSFSTQKGQQEPKVIIYALVERPGGASKIKKPVTVDQVEIQKRDADGGGSEYLLNFQSSGSYEISIPGTKLPAQKINVTSLPSPRCI